MNLPAVVLYAFSVYKKLKIFFIFVPLPLPAVRYTSRAFPLFALPSLHAEGNHATLARAGEDSCCGVFARLRGLATGKCGEIWLQNDHLKLPYTGIRQDCFTIRRPMQRPAYQY